MRKPFFKKSHNAGYVHHQGRMIRLSDDKETAFQLYHELKASQAPAASTDSVATLLNSYLEWCQKNRSQATYEWFKEFLSSFARSIGVRLQIGSLKPLHATQWIDSQESWNATTRFNAIRAVKRVFNWAVREGRLTGNPLRGMESPSPKRRESYLTAEQFQKVLNATSDLAFKDYITFLFETGSRPQEIKLIEAEHCDIQAGRIMIPTSKAKGKRQARVIYFTPEVAASISRLCKRHPTGPIFVNSKGRPWTKNSVNCRFRRIRKKLEKANTPIEGLCATSFRHGFATQALKSGVDCRKLSKRYSDVLPDRRVPDTVLG
jgi:integrase